MSFDLQEIFRPSVEPNATKPGDCYPSFGDSAGAKLTFLVGRYLAAIEKGSDRAIYMGTAIARKIGGTDDVNMSAYFQDCMHASYGALFSEHEELEPAVTRSTASPGDVLRFHVVRAALVVQERNPAIRATKSVNSLNCGW